MIEQADPDFFIILPVATLLAFALYMLVNFYIFHLEQNKKREEIKKRDKIE